MHALPCNKLHGDIYIHLPISLFSLVECPQGAPHSDGRSAVECGDDVWGRGEGGGEEEQDCGEEQEATEGQDGEEETTGGSTICLVLYYYSNITYRTPLKFDNRSLISRRSDDRL